MPEVSRSRRGERVLHHGTLGLQRSFLPNIITSNRHLERCPLERIPALGLEEAVISRLTELARDRNLILELAKSTEGNAQARVTQIEGLISFKTQERRKLEQANATLFQALTEAPGEATRKLLMDKIEESAKMLAGIEAELVDLNAERDGASSSVIDLKSVFELIKTFGRDFNKAPPSTQREALRDFIHKIVVSEEGVTLEYYVGPREDVLPGVSPEYLEIFEPHKMKNPALGSATYRSGFRSLFNLVEIHGFEPRTFSMPWKRSTN